MPDLSHNLLSEEFNWTGLDGEQNLWILKPTNANRGRGIRVVKDLNEILKFARCPPLGCLGNSNPILAAHANASDNLFSPSNKAFKQTLKGAASQKSTMFFSGLDVLCAVFL